MRGVQWTTTRGLGAAVSFEMIQAAGVPTPPPGILRWDLMKEVLKLSSFISPSQYGAISRATPDFTQYDDSRIREYFSRAGYNVSGNRAYARMLQNSWNWWLKQQFTRNMLMTMSYRNRAVLLGNMNRYLAYLNSN